MGQLVPAERVDTEWVVEDRRPTGDDARRSPTGHGRESGHQLEQAGQGHGQPDSNHEFGHRRRVAQVPKYQPLENKPDERGKDEYRQDQRRDDLPSPFGSGLEVHGRRHVGLGTEGQIEDP